MANDLRARIARVYDHHPEGRQAESLRQTAQAWGLRWFAERVHRSQRTVQRWVDGRSPVDPLALEKLERLERESQT